MAEIQFEEESPYQPTSPLEGKSVLVRLVLSTGIVSTDTAAEKVLIGVMVLAVILTFTIPFLFHSSSPKPTPEQRIRALTAPGTSQQIR